MKRIAIFCDGTWNRLSAETPTNVLLGAQIVLSRGEDGVEQLTYYDEGVGTSYLFSRRLETALAGAFGWGLFEKIAAAYRFLVFNYEPGDEIFIFGFSRGAYTARSLAGMLRKCGIVRKGRAGDIPAIFEFYKDANTHPDSDEARSFRMRHSPETILKASDREWRLANGDSSEAVAASVFLVVRYLGVYDTVGALGVPQHLALSRLTSGARRYQFHDTALSSTVRAARHAVAIDEDRLSFEPALWSNLEELNRGSAELKYRQSWFPGVHSAVGGGGDIRGLSSAAFQWIMEGASAEGLALDSTALSKIVSQADHLAPLSSSSGKPGVFDRIYRRRPRIGPEIEAELSEWALMRLEHEVKDSSSAFYRPVSLRRVHRDSPTFRRQSTK